MSDLVNDALTVCLKKDLEHNNHLKPLDNREHSILLNNFIIENNY